jgi:hypothetical protein
MIQLICEAISSKKVIKFNYDGHERVVEPHAYGVHKDSGNEVLCAYQIGGYSSSGKSPYWRLYDVSKMIDILVTEEYFDQPRPGYKMNDSRMSIIFCQIEI